MESFNKTLTKGLTKICNIDKYDWDDNVPAIPWAYRTTYKRETNQTPFKLVYGQEVVVPLHFRQHTLEIAKVLKLDIGEAKYERLFQLQKLEEDRVIALQHQESQKQQQKAWHERNIKSNNILVGDLVLLYQSKIKGKLYKLEAVGMGPYIIEDLNSNGSVWLKKFARTCFFQSCKWSSTEMIPPISHAQLTNGCITIWSTDRHN